MPGEGRELRHSTCGPGTGEPATAPHSQHGLATHGSWLGGNSEPGEIPFAILPTHTCLPKASHRNQRCPSAWIRARSFH